MQDQIHSHSCDSVACGRKREKIMMDVYYINILIRCGGPGAQDDLSLELGGWSETICTLYMYPSLTMVKISAFNQLARAYQESGPSTMHQTAR